MQVAEPAKGGAPGGSASEARSTAPVKPAALRVALVLGGERIPAWQRNLLETLAASAFATVEAVLVVPDEPAADRRPGWRYRLYREYARRDARRLGGRSDAMAPAPWPDFLGTVERLEDGRPGAAALGTRALDLVLVLGGLAELTSFAAAATHGAWYYDHGPGGGASGETAALWEVLGRQAAIHARLCMCDREGRARVLYESWSAIDPLSHAVSRSRHLWKAAQFVPRALERLHALGAAGLVADTAAVGRDESPRERPPTVGRLLAPLAGYLAWRACRKVERRLWRDRWTLMHGSRERRDVARYRKLTPPPGRFWADPHLLRRDGRTWVFFEDGSLQTWTGHIAVFSVDDAGRATPPVTIIERPWHLSYPFILEWEGETWLIPESGDHGTVEAWRCRRFPHEWEFSHCLMSGLSLYDATLLAHGGKWYLFAAMKAHEDASSWDELCIFHADEPLSRDWQPHPLNPVVSDVRRARPAGPFLHRDGRLYRPSQDSSRRYGYALHFNEVLELTPTTYRERPAGTLLPDFGPRVRGVHSWSESGELAVIDVLERIRRRG